jgi:hypothetical protein
MKPMLCPMPAAEELIDGKFQIYRVALDMEALTAAVRDRAEDLNVPRLELDAAGGLQSGYSAKLLCDPPLKTLGAVSLGAMLKATGLALVVVIDDANFAPIKARLAKRRRTVPPNGSIRRPAWLITKESSPSMQQLRNQKLTPRQRKMLAKRAIRARWRRSRAEPAVVTPVA